MRVLKECLGIMVNLLNIYIAYALRGFGSKTHPHRSDIVDSCSCSEVHKDDTV